MTQPPNIVVCEDAQAASRKVAEIIIATIAEKPASVLGLATGSTPIRTYELLVDAFRDERVDFSQATSFNLDEYVGLAPKHPQSFRCFMDDHLFKHVNFSPMRTYVPDGSAADPAAHAKLYDDEIRMVGGVDCQLLGIGHNGHIGFNEPGSLPDSRTSVVDLAELTIRKNARFFDSADQVPRRAITMGIGTILESRHIVLLATGKSKAKVVAQAFEQSPSVDLPASWLQTHDHVTVVLDNDAATVE
ncbi:Glucosamine-6-phosphate deaminase 1 [Planctomycetes bacterium CA13]|uniref:Glucosamine-6-phosphate deaminase n=1 Tax=Novipirellula herctigrandis TaxID=2527986 RepID=A0A5C5YVS7_9BACT|nr:Glucosamine-6-phosphate deaminase 1 [Planctomycetes bacterium CA13]